MGIPATAGLGRENRVRYMGTIIQRLKGREGRVLYLRANGTALVEWDGGERSIVYPSSLQRVPLPLGRPRKDQGNG